MTIEWKSITGRILSYFFKVNFIGKYNQIVFGYIWIIRTIFPTEMDHKIGTLINVDKTLALVWIDLEQRNGLLGQVSNLDAF